MHADGQRVVTDLVERTPGFGHVLEHEVVGFTPDQRRHLVETMVLQCANQVIQAPMGTGIGFRIQHVQHGHSLRRQLRRESRHDVLVMKRRDRFIGRAVVGRKNGVERCVHGITSLYGS